jgi:hypothetical protein
LAKHRPDLPAWLDHALSRTFAVRREDRFQDVLEFIFELEHGEDRVRPQEPRRLSLYDRNPLRFWQVIAAILAALLIAALAVLAKRNVKEDRLITPHKLSENDGQSDQNVSRPVRGR